MRRNRVTAPTDLMSELDSDDDDKKLSTQSTIVSSSTAATRGLSTQKTLVSPAASADKPPNPARTAPKTKVSAKRRQVTNAPSSTQSSGNGLFSHQPSPTIHSDTENSEKLREEIATRRAAFEAREKLLLERLTVLESWDPKPSKLDALNNNTNENYLCILYYR